MPLIRDKLPPDRQGMPADNLSIRIRNRIVSGSLIGISCTAGALPSWQEAPKPLRAANDATEKPTN